MALSDAHMSQFMAAQQQEAREQVLFQFNCGHMTTSGKTVTADPRKGKVVISMEDDGLLRFQWRLRHKDENELQFFIFPNGATWSRVSECKDGCVFLLKMGDTDVKHFFWSQEARTDEKKATKRDAEVLRKITGLIKDPPKFGAPAPTEEDVNMVDVQSSLSVNSAGGVSLIQGTGHADSSSSIQGSVVHPASGSVVAPSTPAPAAASASSASASTPLNTNALMSTLNAMAQQLQARQETQTGVEDVLDPERVQTILDVDSALVDALVEYLPEGQRSPDALRSQLRSPQMQQTMHRLTQILNSSQFGQLMASLSLPVGPNTGLGVDAFIAAIQAQAEKQQSFQTPQKK